MAKETKQQELNELLNGLEESNREMVESLMESAPMCHFMKMFADESDSVEGISHKWWECRVCGHTKNR